MRGYEDYKKFCIKASNQVLFSFLQVANHVLGSVLCSPGCFSVYRATAVRDVLPIYSTKVDNSFDFLTKDMGESSSKCSSLCCLPLLLLSVSIASQITTFGRVVVTWGRYFRIYIQILSTTVAWVTPLSNLSNLVSVLKFLDWTTSISYQWIHSNPAQRLKVKVFYEPTPVPIARSDKKYRYSSGCIAGNP